MNNTISTDNLSQEELKVKCAALMSRLEQELDRASKEKSPAEFAAIVYYMKHELQRVKRKAQRAAH